MIRIILFVLMRRFALGAIGGEPLIDTASPEHVFLRSVGLIFNRTVESVTGEFQEPLRMQSAIHEIIEETISRGSPKYQVNLLAMSLLNFSNHSQGKDYSDLAYALFLVPDVQFKNELMSEYPFARRILRLSHRVGLTGIDMRRFRNEMISQDDFGIADRIEQALEEGEAVPEEILALLSPLSIEFVMLSPAWTRRQLQSSLGHLQEHFPLLLEGTAILLAAPDDCRDISKDYHDAFTEGLLEMAHWGGENEERSVLYSRMNEKFRTTFEDIIRLSESMREKRENLIGKVHTINSDARVLVLPWIEALIERTLALPVIPRRYALLEACVEALVEVLARNERDVSLVAVTEFLERNSRYIGGHQLGEGVAFESTVLHIAFDFARFFGVRLLVDCPRLLPDWSERRVLASRKIMGFFLQFDMPREWETLKIFEVIPKLTETRLEQSVTILGLMYVQRSRAPDIVPLVSPGQWLKALAQGSAGRFVEWVQDMIFSRVVLAGLSRRIFPEAEERIGDFIEVPQRFRDLSDLIHSLCRRFRGDVPEKFFEIFLRRPGDLLRLEVSGGSIGDAVLAVQSGLDILQAAGERKYSNLSALHRQAIEEGVTRLTVILTGVIEGSDVGSGEAIQLFIAKAALLVSAILNDYTVTIPFFA